MVIAAGASAKSQQALGSAVMGGMIAVVILALLLVPVFFVLVLSLFTPGERPRKLRCRKPVAPAIELSSESAA